MTKFNEYIKEIREKNKYDPRRDLVKDSKLWYILLNIAERKDENLYNILHGLRCIGARLLYKNQKLQMVQGKEIENSSWEQYRVDWLFPYAKNVKEIFSDAERYIQKSKK